MYIYSLFNECMSCIIHSTLVTTGRTVSDLAKQFLKFVIQFPVKKYLHAKSKHLIYLYITKIIRFENFYAETKSPLLIRHGGKIFLQNFINVAYAILACHHHTTYSLYSILRHRRYAQLRMFRNMLYCH